VCDVKFSLIVVKHLSWCRHCTEHRCSVFTTICHDECLTNIQPQPVTFVIHCCTLYIWMVVKRPLSIFLHTWPF